MAEEHLADGENESLSRRVHGGVGGLLQYMQAFEMSPHRVDRIGQPSMRKGIRSQQVAEFVMNRRFRHPDPDGDGGASQKGQQSYQKKTACRVFFCRSDKGGQSPFQPPRYEIGLVESPQQSNGDQYQIAKPDRSVLKQFENLIRQSCRFHTKKPGDRLPHLC